jgi:hypothetical protein
MPAQIRMTQLVISLCTSNSSASMQSFHLYQSAVLAAKLKSKFSNVLNSDY